MPSVHLHSILQHLRRVVQRSEAAGTSDGELLERFLANRDEAAFEMLVQRHGPMVLGVCRRILADPHDAEDAFQATFLVLVRKAASIWPRGQVGNWLYGVAYRTAQEARAHAARRRAREKQVDAMDQPEPTPNETWQHLRSLLDQELNRLPAKYRGPVVLCDLEGKTRKEAAQELGWPEGTVSGRLSRARVLLARRLSRQGLALSGGSLAALLAAPTVQAGVPSALVLSTVKAAALVAAGQTATAAASASVAALTEGVVQAMFWTKVKITTVVTLTLGLLVTGAGFLTHRVLAQKPAAAAAPEKPKDAIKKPAKEENGEVVGIIHALDAAKGTISLGDNKKQLGPKSFDIAKEAQVYLDDGSGDKLGFKEGKLSDLTEGLLVHLKLSPDKSKVVGIWAEGPTVSGTVKAVDAGKHTITVSVPTGKKGESGEDKTFTLAKDAKITVGAPKEKDKSGQTIGLADLPVGALVTVKLSVDQKVAASVQADGPTFQGTVKAVDAGKGTITVTGSQGKEKEAVEKTFRISDKTVIVLSGTKEKKGEAAPQAKLSDVPVGAHVIVKLSLDQKTVVGLLVQGAKAAGVLKAVEGTKITVTVSNPAKKEEPGEAKTFALAPDSIVLIDGKEGQLTDLRPGTLVTLQLTPDQQAVSVLNAAGRSLQGKVRGLDAGAGSITLADKSGDHTFTLAKDATIAMDGREAKLAEVPVDALVHARLSADQQTIVHLSVEGPSIKGVVKGVDPSRHVLTLEVPVTKNERENKEFTLAKDARITTAIYGLPIKLNELQAEKVVIVRLSADQKKVIQVTVAGE